MKVTTQTVLAVLASVALALPITGDLNARDSIISSSLPEKRHTEVAPGDYLGGFFIKRQEVKRQEDRAPGDYLGGFFRRQEDRAPGDYLGGFF